MSSTLSRLDELESQVAALQSEKCGCGPCRDYAFAQQQTKAMHARTARFREISSMALADRVSAIKSLAPMDRVLYFQSCGDLVPFLIQVDEDTRKAWWPSVAPSLRDLVEIEEVEIPKLVMLRLAGTGGTWSRRGAINIDEHTAAEINAIEPDIWARRSTDHLQPRWLMRRPTFETVNARVQLPEKVLPILMRADPELAEAITSHEVLVEQIAAEHCRAIVLDNWSRVARADRRPLPRKTV